MTESGSMFVRQWAAPLEHVTGCCQRCDRKLARSTESKLARNGDTRRIADAFDDQRGHRAFCGYDVPIR